MTLYETATQIVRTHKLDKAKAVSELHAVLKKDAAKKDSPLLHEIVAHYVDHVTADIRTGERAQAQAHVQPESRARGRSGPNRRPKLPTAQQKQAALKVASESFIDNRRLRDGRVIGDIKLWELPGIAQRSAQKALEFLKRGFEDAVDAIACARLAMFAQPTSDDMSVRDGHKDSFVSRVYAESRVIAAQRMATASARTAGELLADLPPPTLDEIVAPPRHVEAEARA